jgi:hypothetical protein
LAQGAFYKVGSKTVAENDFKGMNIKKNQRSGNRTLRIKDREKSKYT